MSSSKERPRVPLNSLMDTVQERDDSMEASLTQFELVYQPVDVLNSIL